MPRATVIGQTTCAALVLAAVIAGCGTSKSPDRRAATTATTTTTRSKPPPPPGSALPELAAQYAAVERFARNGQPIYCGAGKRKLVALTFDDGPGPYTAIMLKQLRKAGAHATFFLVGRSVERFGQWPKRERELAAIGEHTMTHANLLTLSPSAAKAEIAGGRATALKAAGAPVALFRPPYGNRDPAIDDEVSAQHMAEILWDVDSADSRIAPTAEFHEISANVRKHAHPGAIVLMHENRGQTIRAVRSILPALKKRGLRPVTIPELLAADPPSPKQLDAGRKGCPEGQTAGAATTPGSG